MSEQLLKARVAALEADNARLRGLLENRGLPAELRHQVRNTLANIRAIMRRSAETERSLEAYAAHLEGRFDAILRVQAVINAGQSDLVDLHSLISNELHRHTASEGEEALITGPLVSLQPRAAEVFALAFHELTVNALKFGALSEAGGVIAISWTIETGPVQPELVLDWQETGVSALARPAKTGFGTEVLQKMLAYELDAQTRLDYRPHGLRFALRLPFSARFGLLHEPTEA